MAVKNSDCGTASSTNVKFTHGAAPIVTQRPAGGIKMPRVLAKGCKASVILNETREALASPGQRIAAELMREGQFAVDIKRGVTVADGDTASITFAQGVGYTEQINVGGELTEGQLRRDAILAGGIAVLYTQTDRESARLMMDFEISTIVLPPGGYVNGTADVRLGASVKQIATHSGKIVWEEGGAVLVVYPFLETQDAVDRYTTLRLEPQDPTKIVDAPVEGFLESENVYYAKNGTLVPVTYTGIGTGSSITVNLSALGGPVRAEVYLLTSRYAHLLEEVA